MDNITDDQLKEFCEWFAGFHGVTTEPSVFTTCMCGHFHTYEKAAKLLMKRCKELRLVVVRKGILTIITNHNKTK